MAREQHVGGERGLPVAHLVGRDAALAAGAGDLGEHVRVPPDVERVDGRADHRGVEVRGDVERLAERRDDRPVGDVHRMQRLDRERDAGGRGIRHQLADRIANALPRTDQVAGALGQPARDEHEDRRRSLGAGGGEGRGLLDRAAVVIDRGAALRALGEGEEAAAAVGREPQARVGRASARRVCRPTSCTGSRQRPIACTPASAVTRRAVARSAYLIVAWLIERRGSGREAVGPVARACLRRSCVHSVQAQHAVPALGREVGPLERLRGVGELDDRARCGRLRAECSPPTIWNAVWWPFSHDRNATPVL